MHNSIPNHHIEVKVTFSIIQEGDKGPSIYESKICGFENCVNYFGPNWPERIRDAAVMLGCRLTSLDCTAHVISGDVKADFKVRFTTMSCMTRMSDQVMAILVNNS